jgi:hypothetical protein
VKLLKQGKSFGALGRKSNTQKDGQQCEPAGHDGPGESRFAIPSGSPAGREEHRVHIQAIRRRFPIGQPSLQLV